MKYFFLTTLSTASNVSGFPLSLPLSDFFFFFYLQQAYRWQEGCVAQFPDGPVEWPWCIQLVHGAHSSLRSRWCLVASPSTRINAAPLGGAKMGEGLQLRAPTSTRVPGHDHRRETINHDHRRRRRLHFPPPHPRGGSHLGSLPLLPASPFRLRESKTSKRRSPTSI